MADKLKTLRTLESICIGGSLVCIGGFLTGALIDNEKLSLIAGGAAMVSAGIGLYASHRHTALERAGYRPDYMDEAKDNQDTNKYNSQSSNQYNTN